MWYKYSDVKPEYGKEVIAYHHLWVDEDFNPDGIRIGFVQDNLASDSDTNKYDFVSAHWWNEQDCYIPISKSDIEGHELSFSENIRNSVEPEYWTYAPVFCATDGDEEPASVWHDVREEPKPNMELICVGQYGNPLVLSSNSNSFKERYISKWAYFNDLLNLSNVERTIKNWKEKPVSDDLETEIDNIREKYRGLESLCESDVIEICEHFYKAGANMQKHQMMTSAVEREVFISFGGNLVVKADGFSEGDRVKVIIIKGK